MDIEVVRGSSNVTLLIPVGSSYTIKIGDQHIMSYVEFPLVIEKRPINIHLDDVAPLALFRLFLLP